MEPRRSLRQRGVASDGVSVVEELRGGAVTTNIILRAEPAQPKERHPKGTAACVQPAESSLPHLAAMLSCAARLRGSQAPQLSWEWAWLDAQAIKALAVPKGLAQAGEVALEDSDGTGLDAAFLAELRARAQGAAERPSVQQAAQLRCGEDDVAKARGLPSRDCRGPQSAQGARVSSGPTSGQGAGPAEHGSAGGRSQRSAIGSSTYDTVPPRCGCGSVLTPNC